MKSVICKRDSLWMILLCMLAILAPAAAVADVPDQISYQGYLTDDEGVPVPDDTYSMHFYLFDAPTGGTQLWNPNSGEVQDVTVTNGVYNVQLGAVEPLDSSVFDGGVAWLQIVVEGEVMSPRQRITATAYALKAGDTDTLAGNAVVDLDARYVNEDDVGVVTSSMIADSTIGASDLGVDSVGASEIAGSAVGSSEVANNSLTAADLGPDSVGNSELAPNSVGSAEIIDGAVTAGDLQDGAARAEILDDDGAGSGLDADFLDGYTSGSFVLTGQDYGRYNIASNLYEGTTTLTSKYVNASGDSMVGSTNGNVLMVDNDITTGGGNALYGRTDAPTGIGVAGFSMNSGAVSNEGGRFMAYGDNGRGVYGRAADSGTGTNYGGYFQGLSSYGRGAYGQASGSYGRGIEGEATSTGSTTSYGGYFSAASAYGYGVYGRATNTGSYTNYGGYFRADGTNGRGVHAYATGGGFGIYGWSVDGDGIYAGTSAANEHAAYFTNSYSVGLAGATVYARAYNSGADGVALWAHNDHTTSTDATAALSNDGSGPLLKGFGGNGGEDEFRINNDGTMIFYNSSHETTVIIDPEEGSGGVGGQITLYDGDGVATIQIDGDYNGDGRVTTQELQITGGSDLSEQFDIKADDIEIAPGLVVSIDPDQPGHLSVSDCAYDNKVAGIISGAGGIKPGMMMGQVGTEADGQHPVALSGRVYCWADTSGGAIQPGDLLTTSDIPGHAMRVTDHTKAIGAMLGKAMTALEDGKGLVLVLVSLQ